MKPYLILTILLLPFVSVFGSDSSFSGLTFERHEQAKADFSEEKPLDMNFLTRKYLLGDWNGVRTRLAKEAITTTSTWTGDILANPIGGNKQAFTYTGSNGLDVVVDLDKYGYQGLSFVGSIVLRGGVSLARWIGNQFPPAQVFGNQSIILDVFYLAQKFHNGRGVVHLGRLNAGDKFLQNPLYYNYVCNAFCGNPISIFFNIPFSAYPNSTWGAYLQYQFAKRILAKFAYYNANDTLSNIKFHGLNWTFNSTNGLLWITEWTYLHQTEKEDCGLPGHYKVALWYLTGHSCRFIEGPDIGNWGWYFLFDQMVYRCGGPQSDLGLTPFIALLFAPGDRNKFPFFFTSGAVWKGLIPCRPDDKAAVGVAYGQYSSDLREVQREAQIMGIPGRFGNQPETYELVFELNYRYQVTPWFFIQPDLQYIANPKGFGTIPNAWVFGAQTGLVF
ncbi:MAG: Porin B [Chlamydiae bacterium]|nr:Porin B [Chlamydiota bacterium]